MQYCTNQHLGAQRCWWDLNPVHLPDLAAKSMDYNVVPQQLQAGNSKITEIHHKGTGLIIILKVFKNNSSFSRILVKNLHVSYG